MCVCCTLTFNLQTTASFSSLTLSECRDTEHIETSLIGPSVWTVVLNRVRFMEYKNNSYFLLLCLTLRDGQLECEALDSRSHLSHDYQKWKISNYRFQSSKFHLEWWMNELKKDMQRDKTQANYKNIFIDLTTRLQHLWNALQIHKHAATAQNTSSGRKVQIQKWWEVFKKMTNN